MQNTDNYSLAAPCGIYCGECPLYKAKDSPELMNRLLAGGLSREQVPCPGCRAIQGNCPVIPSQCETYICASRNKVDFCYQCSDFPCAKLNPASDRANILPHNLKVFNLCYIKEKGLNKFIEEAPGIQERYYSGKMVIGKGPQIS